MKRWLASLLAMSVAACASSDTAAPSAALTLRIVATSGAPLAAVAGDALTLQIVVVTGDGSRLPLPADATFTWTEPAKLTALAPKTAAPPLLDPSVTGAGPTATWLDNPSRADRRADLANVLFILDPGTIQNGSIHVAATVANVPGLTEVATDIPVAPAPLGDARRGAGLYRASCALCHGDGGHGSVLAPGAKSYAMDGKLYDFPAPGLNAESGSVASDPAWNAALFSFSARADIDNAGVALRAPMPDWLTTATSPGTGVVLTTQDLSDIFAFLKTQDR